MNFLLLVLLLMNIPVLAGEPLDVDRFIKAYDTNTAYSFESQPKNDIPKQRIPHDSVSDTETGQTPLQKREALLSQLNNKPVEQNPLSVLLPLGMWIAEKRLELATLALFGFAGYAVISRTRKKNFWERSFQRIQQLIAITMPSLHGLTVDADELTEQVQIQNATKAAKIDLPPFHSSLEAQDPFNQAVPQEVKEVYSWSPEWNPANRPYDFLQCTTFVAMTYNLNGIHLKGKLIGDARDWIYLTDTFDVHAANESRVIPQPMDTMVWTEKGANHVGIVTAVAADRTFQVANGNSTQAVHTFKYHVNPNGTITITNSAGKTAKEAWVPSHWLRLKKRK